jgi:circadian clock protein KaiC
MEFIVNGASHFNEPGVFIAFEETESELVENFYSLGYDLKKLIKNKKVLLDHIHIDRNEIQETGAYDLEGLFIRLGTAIDAIGAKRIALDTIEILFGGLTNQAIVRLEVSRLFRWLKRKGMTVASLPGEKGNGEMLTRFGIEEYVSDCVLALDHRVKDQVSNRRLRILKYRPLMEPTNILT